MEEFAVLKHSRHFRHFYQDASVMQLCERLIRECAIAALIIQSA